MYRKIDDFLTDWEYEATATLSVFRNLTDESLAQTFHADNRTLGRLAYHLTHSIGEMAHRAGLPIEEIAPENEAITKDDLLSLYAREADLVKNAVQTTWKDEDLAEETMMYNEKWAKGFVLSVLIKHQAHHRGQMTVLMRQAGLKVPGIYGPAKEEWAAMGLPAME